MDGIHDLGGMAGFGKVIYEENEPVFHEPWHATAFALNLVSIGALRSYNTDEYRHSIERMAPIHYLQASYYERVLTGAATLLIEKQVVDLDDLENRAGGSFPLALPIADNPMADLPAQPVARFKVSDRVKVKDIHPSGHTRVPRFCRGKTGTVLHVAPAFSFPDAAAHGGKFRKEHTYHVEFASTDLWSEDGADNETVIVDLWDCYLEGAWS
jgi:nitrile hydratase subunit beta